MDNHEKPDGQEVSPLIFKSPEITREIVKLRNLIDEKQEIPPEYELTGLKNQDGAWVGVLTKRIK